MFGFVNTSKLFFRRRNSRPSEVALGQKLTSVIGNGLPARFPDLPCSARASEAVRWISDAEVGLVGDLLVGELVIVGGGDVRRLRQRAPLSTSCFIAGMVSSAPRT